MYFFIFLAEFGLYKCKIAPTVKQLKHSVHDLEPPKSFLWPLPFSRYDHTNSTTAAAASGLVSKPSQLILTQGSH